MTSRERRMKQKAPLVKELRKFAHRHGLALAVAAMNRFLMETREEMRRKKEIAKLERELAELQSKRVK